MPNKKGFTVRAKKEEEKGKKEKEEKERGRGRRRRSIFCSVPSKHLLTPAGSLTMRFYSAKQEVSSLIVPSKLSLYLH